jgi:hypothetical protein
MLPIDELIAKATSTTTNVQADIPQLWQAFIEKNLRKHAVMEQNGSVLVNLDLEVPNAGDTIFIPLLPDLGPATQLTEGTDMTMTSLTTATSVPLVPSEWGVAVEVTRKALDRMKADGVAEVVDRLAYSMSQAIEGALFGLYNATVGGTGNGQSLTTQYPNGHTSGTVVSTDTASDLVLLAAIAQLETLLNIPYDDGYYRWFITPLQFKQLIQDQNIRQDLRYAAPERLLNGEKGALHGVRIIVSMYVNTATQNGTAVAFSMLIAPRWAAIAYKRRPEVVVDPTLYDMGRRRRFGVTADFAVGLVHWERAVIVVTANV